PPISDQEHQVNNANQLAVANFGRKPGLELFKGDQTILLQDWATEILESMRPICAILDNEEADKPYSAALTEQQRVINIPDLTASARILSGMTQTGLPFSRFALNKSAEHARYFRLNKLDAAHEQGFTEMAELSLAKQKEIEGKVQIPFDDFLKQYFSQK
ncbi:MAG: glutamate--cysteine ligase, partial [Methylococcales bacterium]|nr:glutamate--cysteine ligase [Methylococcales bacterium]